jgi:hypothetical protein
MIEALHISTDYFIAHTLSDKIPTRRTEAVKEALPGGDVVVLLELPATISSHPMKERSEKPRGLQLKPGGLSSLAQKAYQLYDYELTGQGYNSTPEIEVFNESSL